MFVRHTEVLVCMTYLSACLCDTYVYCVTYLSVCLYAHLSISLFAPALCIYVVLYYITFDINVMQKKLFYSILLLFISY